jgi:hypothetical protein
MDSANAEACHGTRCTLRGMSALERYGLAPDPVIEYYKKDVDRTLLREHLKLTPPQRLEKLVSFMRSLDALREAAAARKRA